MIKIKSRKFEITQEYPAFKLGTDTDSDVLARMCGIRENEEVVKASVIIEKDNKLYTVNFSLCSIGEQRRISFIKKMSQKDKDILDKANSYELVKEDEIEFMALQIQQGNLEYGNNCWYEADIEILDENKDSVLSDWESNLGLDGVWESIHSFKVFFEDDESLISNIDYLLEENKE